MTFDDWSHSSSYSFVFGSTWFPRPPLMKPSLAPPSHDLHICPLSCHSCSCVLHVIWYSHQKAFYTNKTFFFFPQQRSKGFGSTSTSASVSSCNSRVSLERGQSRRLTLCHVTQQPRALPLLPLSTQVPPSDPQGESWPEDAQWWPPLGTWTRRNMYIFFVFLISIFWFDNSRMDMRQESPVTLSSQFLWVILSWQLMKRLFVSLSLCRLTVCPPVFPSQMSNHSSDPEEEIWKRNTREGRRRGLSAKHGGREHRASS